MVAFVQKVALMVLFGVTGAGATLALWLAFSATVVTSVPPRFVELWCFGVGLAGPLVVGACVWALTRSALPATRRLFRGPAAAGLAIVLAAELAFYVPIGLISVAFHGSPM